MKRRDLIKLAVVAPFIGISFEQNRKLTPQIIEEIGDKLLPKKNKANKIGKRGKIEDYDSLLNDLQYTQIRTEKQLIDLIKTNLEAIIKYDELVAARNDDEAKLYGLSNPRKFKKNETPFFYNHTGLIRQTIRQYGNLSKYGIKQV